MNSSMIHGPNNTLYLSVPFDGEERFNEGPNLEMTEQVEALNLVTDGEATNAPECLGT